MTGKGATASRTTRPPTLRCPRKSSDTAWAYGSRVKWTSRPQSDLDIVVFATPEQRRQVGDLREAFEESNLPFLVNLFVWDDVPESFKDKIEAQRVVLTSNDIGTAPGWRRRDVSDLIQDGLLIVGDGYRAKNSELSGSGLPFARAGNIADGFRFSGADRFPEDGLDKIGDKASRPGDVVFTSKGTVGRFAFVRGDTEHFVYSPQLCFWRSLNHKVIDPYFLYCWMRGPEFFRQFRGVAGQTDMAEYVSLTDQRRMFVTLPALAEQRAIACVLRTLDDKIELNRRMNATLDAMARALFKSWFVDFDPVRAKIRKRDTGLPKDIADLFPDRMVNSELGEIPIGWEVKPLGDLLDLVYGNALKADNRRHDGDVPVYGSNGQVGWHDRRLVQGPGIVVGRKGNPGTVTWAAMDFFPIDTTFYVVPKGKNHTLHFLFFALKGQDLPAIAADSVVPGLNRNLAYMNRQIIPAGQIVEHFNRYVDPIFTRSNQLDVESATLALLRDTLLPRLTSGDLRVGDAESFIQQAS